MLLLICLFHAFSIFFGIMTFNKFNPNDDEDEEKAEKNSNNNTTGSEHNVVSSAVVAQTSDLISSQKFK